MIEFLQNNISELFSAFALFLSAAANWRIVITNRELKRSESAARKMNILIEIEKKNAAVGKLTFTTAQKIHLIQKNPNLTLSPDIEIERLKNNLGLLQNLKESDKKQRNLAEEIKEYGTDSHADISANIQRLRISIEAELEKESAIYNQMLEEARLYRS